MKLILLHQGRANRNAQSQVREEEKWNLNFATWERSRVRRDDKHATGKRDTGKNQEE